MGQRDSFPEKLKPTKPMCPGTQCTPRHAAHHVVLLHPSAQPAIPGRIKAALTVKLKYSQRTSKQEQQFPRKKHVKLILVKLKKSKQNNPPKKKTKQTQKVVHLGFIKVNEQCCVTEVRDKLEKR